MLCAVLGAGLGVFVRRRLLAALLAALLTLALCVVSACADSTPASLRFLFFPGNGYELIARQRRVASVAISAVMVAALSACVLAALTRHHPAPRYTALTLLAIITIAAVGSAAVGPKVRGHGTPRRRRQAAPGMRTNSDTAVGQKITNSS